MNPDELTQQIDALVDETRETCLWLLRNDYYPRTPTEQLRVLEAIQKEGALEVFQRAARLKQWLSPNFSERSADS